MDHKIRDIKSVRTITAILGRLGISECCIITTEPTYTFDGTGLYTGMGTKEVIRYGVGLVQGKEYVERLYNYQHMYYTPRKQVERGNEIHEIKRTRQLMSLLGRLGLKHPDAGLQVCRTFVTRRRATR